MDIGILKRDSSFKKSLIVKKIRNIPKSRIYRMVRKGEVRINSGRAKPCRKLSLGDKVRVPSLAGLEIKAKQVQAYLAPGLNKKTQEITIIADKPDFFIINKPIDIAAHGVNGDNLGLVELVRQLYPSLNLQLVHRLDRNTSGCQLISKKQKFLRECNILIRERKVLKKYTALVHGQWPDDIRIVENKLSKNINISGERMVKISNDGKDSITEFKILEKGKFFTKLSCNLITGRTHQIRVHTSSKSFPIVGDLKYGDKDKDKNFLNSDLKRMYLHSKSLEMKDLSLKISCEEPKEFKKMIKVSESESFLS